MPTRRSSRNKTRTSSSSRRKVVAVDTITEPIVVKPVKDVVTERTEVTKEPEVEIRRPATLAQALTQPAVAVVKPKTTGRRRVVQRKRVA